MLNPRRHVGLLIATTILFGTIFSTTLRFAILAAASTPTAQPTDQPAPQASIVVNSLLDDPNGCPQTCTLRSAINFAPVGGVIGFAGSLKGSIKLADVIDITKDVTISGPGPDAITIDGQKQSQLFTVNNATLKIYGLSLQKGMTKNLGGALEVQQGGVELYDSRLDGNTATEGGAVYLHSGSQFVAANMIFSNNRAGAGGAISIFEGATVKISDSLFQDNSATVEGGALANAGHTQITRTTFSGNIAHKPSIPGSALYNGGGAIYNILTGRLAITACTFTKNQSENDGGAFLNVVSTAAPDLTSIVIDSSTFNGNVADHNGGAIANYQTSPLTLINSTLAGNLAKDSGGAFYNRGGVAQIQSSTLAQNGAKKAAGGILIESGTVSLTSSIVAGNIGKPADISGKVKSGGSNLIGDPNGTSGLFASDQQKVDPLLQPLAPGNVGYAPTMALSPGSPAIGKGTACPDTDERGVRRKNPCDVGAYEAGQ